MDDTEEYFSFLNENSKKHLVGAEKFYSKLIKDFDESSFEKELIHVDNESTFEKLYRLNEGLVITALHIPYDTQRVEIEIWTEFTPYIIKLHWNASSDKSLERILEESNNLPDGYGLEDFIRIVPHKPFIYLGKQEIKIRLKGTRRKEEYYLELCKYPGKLIEHTFPFIGKSKYFNSKYKEMKQSILSFPKGIKRMDNLSMYVVDLLDGKDPWYPDYLDE